VKKIITVLGEVAADELGVTMPHEHVICDISLHSGNEKNRITDINLAIQEVKVYREAGGNSLVDVTTVDIRRNPVALRQVSEATGVNIITTTGLYCEDIYPPSFWDADKESLARLMIDEAVNGIGETGIRPGVIGELGSKNSTASPAEETVLRASALTHLETGLAIVLHSALNRPAPDQVRILREEGVTPERIIVSHADIVWHEDIQIDLAYHLSLLDIGCYLSFDTIGWQEFSPEDHKIACILALIERGYADRLLLSSDLCRRTFYHANGGRGYDYVIKSFVPRLKEMGVSDADINRILVSNPTDVLAV
jgi:phosphotriesterase-related protein